MAADNQVQADLALRGKLLRLSGRVVEVGTMTLARNAQSLTACSGPSCANRSRRARKLAYVKLGPSTEGASGEFVCIFAEGRFEEAASFKAGTTAEVAGYVRDLSRDSENRAVISADGCVIPRAE
jgi:hypothetical protein